MYPELPWTLALNQAEDAAPGPAQMFTFSLTVESDARTIARRLRDDAAQYVAIVGGDTPLMKRFAVAFTAEWLQGGGTLPHSVPFDPAPGVLTQLKRDFDKKIPDAALLAVDGNDASLAKPYIGIVPAFASGLVFDRKSTTALRDLDGLTVVEIPWLVTPNAPEFAKFPRKEFASASLERLYALGLDAFRIAQALKNGPPDHFVMDGATGRIALGEGRQFLREGRLAIYRGGQLLPLDGGR
jgi:outer membrane PBP1 activator LpoA protein